MIIVDTAHGHSQGVLDRVRWIKKNYPDMQVIGGNIATGEAAQVTARCRRRRRESRHRARLHLHHAHGGRCRRSADHRDRECRRCAEGFRRSADRRRRHPLFRRYRQGHRGRRARHHGRQPAGRHRRSARSRSKSTRAVRTNRIAAWDRSVRWARVRATAISRKAPRRDKAGAGRRRRPRAVQGADDQHHSPAHGRPAFQHGLYRQRRYRSDAHQAQFVRITNAGIRESHVHDVKVTKEAPNYQRELSAQSRKEREDAKKGEDTSLCLNRAFSS